MASKAAFCLRMSDRTSTNMSAGDMLWSRISCSMLATRTAASCSSFTAAAALRKIGRRDSRKLSGSLRSCSIDVASSSSSKASSITVCSRPNSFAALSRRCCTTASLARRSSLVAGISDGATGAWRASRIGVGVDGENGVSTPGVSAIPHTRSTRGEVRELGARGDRRTTGTGNWYIFVAGRYCAGQTPGWKRRLQVRQLWGGAAQVCTRASHILGSWALGEQFEHQLRVARLHARAVSVTAVASAPDGRWIASGSYDGSLRLWSVAQGSPLRALNACDGSCHRAGWQDRGERRQ